MKMNTGKTAVLFVVAIMALASIGVAYALWSEDLIIDGEVNTGTLSWKFQIPVTVTDVYCPPPYYPTDYPDMLVDPNSGLYGGDPVYGIKNVACGSAVLVDENNIQLIVTDAYPGYYNHMDFWVKCDGTVPLVIDSLLIYDAAGNLITEIYEMGIHEFDITGEGDNDMQIEWGHPFGEPGAQLHEGDKRDISFGFCFLQPLPEDSIIVLYLTLRGIQYNEWVPHE